jgi:hypothetical protein
VEKCACFFEQGRVVNEKRQGYEDSALRYRDRGCVASLARVADAGSELGIALADYA